MSGVSRPQNFRRSGWKSCCMIRVFSMCASRDQRTYSGVCLLEVLNINGNKNEVDPATMNKMLMASALFLPSRWRESTLGAKRDPRKEPPLMAAVPDGRYS